MRMRTPFVWPPVNTPPARQYPGYGRLRKLSRLAIVYFLELKAYSRHTQGVVRPRRTQGVLKAYSSRTNGRAGSHLTA